MPRIGRTSVLQNASSVNLSAEAQEIAEGKIYAGRRKKSLSEVLFDLLRPLVAKDKSRHPESYGDRQEAAAPDGK